MDKPKNKGQKGLERIVPGDPADPQARPLDIPSFDLDRQIRAHDRKATSTRRKGPKACQQTSLTNKTQDCNHIDNQDYCPWRPAMTSQQQHVIAQIVAKDINNILHGNQALP